MDAYDKIMGEAAVWEKRKQGKEIKYKVKFAGMLLESKRWWDRMQTNWKNANDANEKNTWKEKDERAQVEEKELYK